MNEENIKKFCEKCDELSSPVSSTILPSRRMTFQMRPLYKRPCDLFPIQFPMLSTFHPPPKGIAPPVNSRRLWGSRLPNRLNARKWAQTTMCSEDRRQTNLPFSQIRDALGEHSSQAWSDRVASLTAEDDSFSRISNVLRKFGSTPTQNRPLHAINGLGYSSEDKLERVFRNVLLANDEDEVLADHVTNRKRALSDARMTAQIGNRRRDRLKSPEVRIGLPISPCIESFRRLWRKYQRGSPASVVPKPLKACRSSNHSETGKGLYFPQNYRPISLHSNVSKTVGAVILSRLKIHTDKLDIVQDE